MLHFFSQNTLQSVSGDLSVKPVPDEGSDLESYSHNISTVHV